MEFPRALFRLNEFMQLQDAGCPIGRHELTDHEWLALGALKATRAELERDEWEQEQERKREHGN